MNNETDYDLCIIGGGINGAGIARDAAGRGLSVLLVEKGDIAGATSSASTKLVHGGLRYLEYFEFDLVRHALQEREVLLNTAPHIVRPLTFLLPYEPHLRPAWMIRLGLFLYDHLAKRKKLDGCHSIKFPHGILEPQYKKGFSYQDCWVDDARLVILNIMDAAKHSASIMTRTPCKKIEPREKSWTIYLEGNEPVTSRMVVNATGPWVRGFLENSNLAEGVPGIRLVKGSHIIVPRFTSGDEAYILQQPDRRIVFAIPYEHDFTLIGTTEEEFKGDPVHPEISNGEIGYLCDAVNRSFRHKVKPEDIIKTYSGVRPLLDDGDKNASAVTRDYKLILDESYGAPLLSVFGGKITTFRYLAEEAVDQLTDKPAWTANAPLPGGNIPDFKNFLEATKALYKHLPEKLVERYAHAYGTLIEEFISEDMGTHFGDNVYEAEVRYLIEHEWAQTVEDVLWRRSKLGLHIAPETAQNLESYIKESVLNHDRTNITGH